MRTLRIVPKSPLKSDTRYKVALDASKLTGGKAKGVAEFEFSTPKLRFSYNPCWLQQSDDLKYYVLVGETVSSDYVAADYVEQRLKIKGLLKPEVAWTHSEDGTVHKYRVENIPTRSDESYKLTLDFDLDPKQNVEMEVPQGRIHRTGPHRADRAAGRGRHLLRAAQAQPGFQKPDPLRPEIPDLGRPEPPLHLPRNATHG